MPLTEIALHALYHWWNGDHASVPIRHETNNRIIWVLACACDECTRRRKMWHREAP